MRDYFEPTQRRHMLLGSFWCLSGVFSRSSVFIVILHFRITSKVTSYLVLTRLIFVTAPTYRKCYSITVYISSSM